MDEESGYGELSADDLKEYMASHHERDYLLIDVRQPGEYEQTHIPGATLLPLPEFESRLFELPGDRDLIFYCKVGSRSQMAAMLAGEGEVTEKPIYHLSGGISAFSGKTLSEFPRLKAFEAGGSFPELLFSAMNMEKGAERFYEHVRERYKDQGFSKTFDQLARVETAHARIIYDVYKKIGEEPEPEPFDSLYESLAGDIMEGGESLSDMMERLEAVEENACIPLMELALSIEYAAYDLYRSAATRMDTEAETADLFLDIAQAEKSHMRMIARALAECGGDGRQAGQGAL
jgi:rubrerythrin/rhodanese-related sulfurtransferase